VSRDHFVFADFWLAGKESERDMATCRSLQDYDRLRTRPQISANKHLTRLKEPEAKDLGPS